MIKFLIYFFTLAVGVLGYLFLHEHLQSDLDIFKLNILLILINTIFATIFVMVNYSQLYKLKIEFKIVNFINFIFRCVLTIIIIQYATPDSISLFSVYYVFLGILIAIILSSSFIIIDKENDNTH